MNINTLHDLYLDQIQAAHSCEVQVLNALPLLMRAAQHPELKAELGQHIKQSGEHLQRLDTILAGLQSTAHGKTCEVSGGLIHQAVSLMDHTADPEVRDVGLICSVQKIEHYEIATYGCLKSFAMQLDRRGDIAMLELTMDEEKRASAMLSVLARVLVNADVVA